jgi:hypothetical protein
MRDNGKSPTSDILIRLERLEDSFLTGLHEIRADQAIEQAKRDEKALTKED